LRVFVRVVGEGSFAGAARVLDLAPAVVTRSVAELEAHLGARLLNRTTRRLALTEIGLDYVGRAQRILAELDDADALAGESTRQPRGSLRILCPPAFASHQLARHLPRFRERYPQLALEVATPGAVATVDENFDVTIISVGQQALEGDFIARRIASSTFLICAAPAYLDRRGRPTDPDELLLHDGILPAVSALRRELTLFRCDEFANDGAARVVTLPTPTAALSTSHIDMILAAAIAGLGIAGLPSFVADEALRQGRLERVLPGWRGLTLTIHAAMPTRQHVPARTRAFIDFLVQTFASPDGDPWLNRLAQRT
jgi:DNA-binding transcriptional LysR family regulator